MTPTSLRAVMSALRKPGTGCPWDLEQDHGTLARYLREEAAEVLDALAALEPGNPERERHLCEELGDLWLQVAFHAQIAHERGAWDLADVEAMVVEKLVRRHPHVFGEVEVSGSDDVLVNWAAIKQDEKAGRGETARKRLLESMPASLSPLDEAMEIGRKCGKVGFDWEDLDGVLDKVGEEIRELQAESDLDRVEAEFGDVLFTLVQWARKKGVDPDRALRRQMARFRGRFRHVEDHAEANGGWEAQDMEAMEAAWQRAKAAGTEAP
ncbi:nucleoside triphosphate pyrophosphohydrolase [Mesoterricola sediminis]|uniref:Nucleoside triphosphate pyrophosphohydrolase n=1 Tax=Mesoterricola sediminis TaxID=2927980 RepID=A0AA48KDT5_9BACT|nr:nucleoside triphosphate pyrophosphohydrolase [Mesoterricola sediminis]BDU77390.1 nucleoside triphosphate pyrophosphohydrolase [Mesoterricola sediminis]